MSMEANVNGNSIINSVYPNINVILTMNCSIDNTCNVISTVAATYMTIIDENNN